MKKELKERVVNLLAAIHDDGLDEVVAENYVFQTLRRIIKTGSSLRDGFKEPVADTEYCAEVLSNPSLWGIDDPAWKAWLDQRGIL